MKRFSAAVLAAFLALNLTACGLFDTAPQPTATPAPTPGATPAPAPPPLFFAF